MLYTRKGDGATTKTLHCDQRFSKSLAVAEALGAVDELNSLLGFVGIKCQGLTLIGKGESLPQGLTLKLVLGEVQQNLFIVQAELAGAPPRTQRGSRPQPFTISSNKVRALEKIIDGIEQELPPIKSFFVAGGTELGTLLDYARTVARRAERRVVAATVAATKSEVRGLVKIGPPSLAYLNRLSSLLYALARLVNHQSGINEQAPHYQ